MRSVLLGEPHIIHGYTVGENTVELAYNFMKRAEIFVSLQTSVVITEEYNVMVNSEELIGTAISDAMCEVTHKPMSL
jgi:hypothetical protein